jgi:Protein of unknown function (DUF3662)/FHA domain
MSVLKSLESRIAGLVEGTFSRAFRSEVRPVEVARRLAREMDQHRIPFVSRVYVPAEYVVFLSEADYERFGPAKVELVSELSAYLLEHARREKFVLPTRPRITIESDRRLGLGEFGIKTIPIDRSSLGDGESQRRQPEPPASPVAAKPPVAAPATAVPIPPAGRIPVSSASTGEVALVAGSTRIPLGAAGAVIGRSSSCEIVLEDPNASRRHAAVRPVPAGWQLEDLGSTNGVMLNGRKLGSSALLRNGDRIALGHTELVFEQG